MVGVIRGPRFAGRAPGRARKARLAERGLRGGEIVRREHQAGVGREVGGGQVDVRVAKLAGDLAECARPVLYVEDDHLLLSGDLDSGTLQRFERGSRILYEYVNLCLPSAAGERAQAGDVGAALAEHIPDPCQLARMIIEIERQIGRHDPLLSCSYLSRRSTMAGSALVIAVRSHIYGIGCSEARSGDSRPKTDRVRPTLPTTQASCSSFNGSPARTRGRRLRRSSRDGRENRCVAVIPEVSMTNRKT